MWQGRTERQPQRPRRGEHPMNRSQFDLALNWLRLQDPPLVLPFGLRPGEEPGGAVPTFTAETWRDYRWNPPGAQAYEEGAFDETASAKPTWAMLQAALPPAQLESARRAALGELHDLCRSKITAQYGVRNIEDEILLRLRDGESAAQNTERDRRRQLYQSAKAAINAATTTAAVESLLASALADSFWAPPSD